MMDGLQGPASNRLLQGSLPVIWSREAQPVHTGPSLPSSLPGLEAD